MQKSKAKKNPDELNSANAKMPNASGKKGTFLKLENKT